MEFNKILIRYGELGLKSPPVRRRFLDRLVTNIHKGLDSEGIDYKITKTRGRIFVETGEIEKACSLLKKVFGIVSFSPVVEIESNLSRICEKVTEISKNYLEKGDKFAIRARRAGSHNFTSKMVERKIGKEVLEANKGVEVDLDNPDKTIFIEVRQIGSFIFSEKINGAGGLPLGTQGKVVALISDTLYSPIACWLLMKRGCSIILVFLENSPYENLKEEIKKITEILKSWSIGEKFLLKKFKNGDNIFKIKENVEKDLGYIINQRIIYRSLERIAERNNAKAIISPDTSEDRKLFENFQFVDEVVKIPILRPLIGLDKEEIEQLAMEIGNYEVYQSSKKSKLFTKKRKRIKRKEIKEAEERLDIKEMIEKI